MIKQFSRRAVPYELLRHAPEPLVAPDHDGQSAPRHPQPGVQLDQSALRQRTGHGVQRQAGKTCTGHGQALDGLSAVGKSVAEKLDAGIPGLRLTAIAVSQRWVFRPT